MRTTSKVIEKILEKYKEIHTLNNIGSILGWDLNVNLPYKASEGRSRQSSYITEITTNLWIDKSFRALIEKANEQDSLTQEERAVVRNLVRNARYYWRVPKEIIVQFSEVTSKAYMAWVEAKKKDSFEEFLPHLKMVVKMSQIIADYLGYKDNRYDALLDLYEPELTTEECKKIFSTIQPELTDLLKRIQTSSFYNEKNDLVDGSFSYDPEIQKQISLFVLRKMGYDMDAGSMDISPHPFTSTLDRFDVRITNRYKSTDFRESIMVAMHEGGHALYEQGVREDYEGTPLDGGISLGIHESQSRFWENQIGRSHEFLHFLTPILQAFYPDVLAKVGEDTITRTFNHVEPSLIRVEADEVTYNLHIALRFELEEALINDKIKPSELPEAWNEKMQEFLGVKPESDRDGVLQDVHWSGGSFGYFPTYTLGNLYASQITHMLKQELDISDLSKKGELGTILSWLRSNVHTYGSMYFPKELIRRISKKELDPKYFLDYLNQKYTPLYEIPVEVTSR